MIFDRPSQCIIIDVCAQFCNYIYIVYIWPFILYNLQYKKQYYVALENMVASLSCLGNWFKSIIWFLVR